ncbi:MAG: nucleotidyltransferase domain-containing protein [Rhodobacteraceae bacterium]|nr:nucleotidyltransferase domain-containing protein [Paracoccaceae bacterium]
MTDAAKQLESAHSRITTSLREVALAHGVRILFAVESGSRAWGFASPDSDYDVRFVFVRPVDDYLRLQPMRDVIELPIRDDLDMVGWDLRKALGLLIKPNPVLLEWLGSPVRYQWDGRVGAELTALAADTGYHRACTAHYARLAAGEWHSHIEGRVQVSLKGYFYATRATLCVRWLLAGRDGPPPVRLRDVLSAVRLPPDTATAIDQLVSEKGHGTERVTGPRRPLLDQLYLETQDQVGDLPPAVSLSALRARADGLFQKIVLGRL